MRGTPPQRAADANGHCTTFKTASRNMHNDNDITIGQAQLMVDKWVKTYGVRYFSELSNMACLTEEVGELARIMVRRYGDQSAKAGEKLDLADEMADVLWVLLCLANQTGVDLTDALRRNMQKKTARDSARHLNNPKLAKPSIGVTQHADSDEMA